MSAAAVLAYGPTSRAVGLGRRLFLHWRAGARRSGDSHVGLVHCAAGTDTMTTWRALKYWLWRMGPAAVVMAVIFFASSQPKGVLPDYGANDWNVKKLAHVLIYATLAVAYLHALAAGRKPTWRQAVAAVVLAGLYGATDEFHQSFVAGRGAGPVDVAIDTFGATLGALLGGWLYGRFIRTPTPPAHLPSTR